MALSIDDLLRRAVEQKASDLHLKVGNHPYLRVDGTLAPITDVPRITPEEMLSMAFSMMTNRQKQKFKESAELDMAYGVAGLGRFRVNVFQQRGNVGMVLRVIPTKIRTSEELNLPPVINKICEEQRGLVLVTGTTGSGKSTTLAAMIDRVNATRSDHLITIEDPIEFLHRDKRSFINQREVEVDTANFSTALRAALRQDPDVILVGEMRDLETISTALLAAETGHLVFSTLHTNDAAGAISRLLEMGVQDYLLSSSLLGVLAQRLVRRLCTNCRKEISFAGFDGNEPELTLQRMETVWDAAGCDRCSGTGYLGRVGIFELLPVTSEVCKVIVQRADAGMIRSLAVQQGMHLLREDGWDKVRQGVTTVAEVLRVTREEA